MAIPSLPSSISSGVRAAGAVDSAVLIGQPQYVDAANRYAIRFSINAGEAPAHEALIPEGSEWFVLVEATYPLGSIDVYPSKQHSIVETFQHQNLNLPGIDDYPWRTGKICLDSPVSRLGLIAPGHDPVGDPEARLKWHLSRAVAWVRAAAQGTLIQSGDPFELPFCQATAVGRIVHDESRSSFSKWDGFLASDWGLVELETIVGIENTELAVEFFTRDGTIVRTCNRHGEKGSESRNGMRRTGVWWLWPSPAILRPWRIPLTWHDLRSAGKTAGVDVDSRLRQIARSIRGDHAKILLLGYPIPERYDQEPAEVHWQAILLPKITAGGKPPDGFRSNERGWWHRDRHGAFDDRGTLEYIRTANWHPDRMQARGKLDQQLQDARIALVGCGALGSIVAELLIRGGVSNLLLVDGEELAAENLVRHTLSGQEIGKNKAAALAQRLASTAPFATLTHLDKRLPYVRGDVEQLLDDFDLVIDCTGAEDVVMALSLGWWSIAKVFVSVSVGYEARRTFVFAHRGHSFPEEEFRNKLKPHLQRERVSWGERGETLEGAGCWSPLFPARLDDLLLAAGSSIKVIEKAINDSAVDARLVVFEQVSADGFAGIRRIDAATAEQDGGE